MKYPKMEGVVTHLNINPKDNDLNFPHQKEL